MVKEGRDDRPSLFLCDEIIELNTNNVKTIIIFHIFVFCYVTET